MLLAIMTLTLAGTVLVTTNQWNPWPEFVSWWDRFTSLSEPPPAWDARVGGVPDLAAVMATGQVVVASRGFVDAYDRSTGIALWQRQVHWALPAGDVVVVRARAADPDADRGPDRGYSVLSPLTGTVVWAERDAMAVWAYADRVVDLVCVDDGPCQLRGRAHADGQALWTTPMPAGARTLSGPNPALLGPRDPADWFAPAAAGSPGRLPAVIGLVVDGVVQVVDTVDGQRVREATAPDRATRLSLSGERVLMTRAVPDESGCQLRVEGRHYRSGALAWARDGLDLDTADGAGCEQRDDPLGSGGHLAAVGPDNRPVLVAAANGRVAWTGGPGERVLASDGELAVIEGADRRGVRVVDLLDPETRTVWSRELGLRPRAAVTPDYVIISDTDEGRLIVLSHVGLTALAEVTSKATVVGHGPGGILLASGRKIGLLPLPG
jgi:outer membrane protein assembly factor BamB